MATLHKAAVGLFLLIIVQVKSENTLFNGITKLRKKHTRVLSLPPEDMIKKQTLSEVGTYAELKDDPNSSPLQSFTICSTIMATILQNPYPVFFNILDDQQSQI